MRLYLPSILAALLVASSAGAQICNLKVVTDASPDYTDLPSLVRSITAGWKTPEEKCWALFYWNHIARRQTAPMMVHGLELTDPIRQFNDYGYTQCSTVSGINCGIWQQLGLPVRFWDISLHTVPEVYYGGRWHMVDNSMSALYTLCDGHTIAGVEDIGKEGACAASGGKRELGHIAKYHCLYSTSPNGFLTGADTQRSLDEESRCFNPNGLKLRTYYNNWEWGHRYILNLRPSESYTRNYQPLGSTPDYFVPNEGKDPDQANPRYHVRGNGQWVFRADLSPSGFRRSAYSASNITAAAAGVQPSRPAMPAQVVFKAEGANVITSQRLRAAFTCKPGGSAAIRVSADNGLRWRDVWKSGGVGRLSADVHLREEVNGAYEVLIGVDLQGDARLTRFEAETVTMLNAKTQPRLNLGRNMVYIGGGDQTDSTVLWPELQGRHYRETIVTAQNVASEATHPGYTGTVYPQRAGQDAFLVYRLDAPSDIRRVVFGGRFHNRARKSRIELLTSVDGMKTWSPAWQLSSTQEPWDVVHYETVTLSKGHRTVWLKALMNSPDASAQGCSIYSLRMEADYAPVNPAPAAIQVTFAWAERQADGTLVERSHTHTVTSLPTRYPIDVGGADHPVMRYLRVSAGSTAKEGYSDGKDAGGAKFVGRWETLGRNLAIGKRYTVSTPSETTWGAGDPNGIKLTDGIVGPPVSGGITMSYGAIWKENTNPVITLDLGAPTSCASFGMNVNGYPWWDALKGEVEDRVEVLTSVDGSAYISQGFLDTHLRWKDLPVNHMWPDDEEMTAATFRCIPPTPVTARYVRYKVTSKRFFDCTELEVLDSIRYEPFDLRITLPGE